MILLYDVLSNSHVGRYCFLGPVEIKSNGEVQVERRIVNTLNSLTKNSHSIRGDHCLLYCNTIYCNTYANNSNMEKDSLFKTHL